MVDPGLLDVGVAEGTTITGAPGMVDLPGHPPQPFPPYPSAEAAILTSSGTFVPVPESSLVASDPAVLAVEGKGGLITNRLLPIIAGDPPSSTVAGLAGESTFPITMLHSGQWVGIWSL